MVVQNNTGQAGLLWQFPLPIQARVLLNPGDPVLLEEFSYSHHVDAHLLQMG